MTIPRPLSERFWPKVNKDGPTQPHMDTCCWIWIGAITSCGYGCIQRRGRNSVVSAHIASWELENGPIPEGICVLHQCDNPICVRPDHLFLGTKKDNTADAIAKGRHYFNEPPMLYGTKSPCAKISEEDALIIRFFRKHGAPAKMLARIFSISKTEVYRVGSGQRFNPDKINQVIPQ